MSYRLNPVKDYFRVKVESAGPMGLVYMIYERALATLAEAKNEVRSRNRDAFCQKVIHAQDCLRELRSSLNLEVGPVAHSLYRLYDYMINQLIEANLSRGNPMPYLVGVERMLRELYHTWKTAESRHKAASSSSGHSRPEDSSIEAFSATG